MRFEIDTIIGKKLFISLNDVKQLVYAEHIFKETLRIWPPITSINRVTNEIIEIDGLSIPEDTHISV